MRRITLLTIHCSATRCGQPYSFEDCRRDHIARRRFRDIGYHYYITRDGRVHPGRPLSLEGAHCFGHNRHSIGICYEGGLDGEGNPADTRTPPQKAALAQLLQELGRQFPAALTVGHRDLDPKRPALRSTRRRNTKKTRPVGGPEASAGARLACAVVVVCARFFLYFQDQIAGSVSSTLSGVRLFSAPG